MAVVGPHQPDVDPRQPLVQGRASTSSSRATRKATAASARVRGPGSSTFNTDTNNPFDTNYSYANALLGSFQNYTEIDKFSEVQGQAATSRSSTCRTRGRPTGG